MTLDHDDSLPIGSPASTARQLVDATRASRLIERLCVAGEGEASRVIVEEVAALFGPRPGLAMLVDSAGRVRATSDAKPGGSFSDPVARVDMDAYPAIRNALERHAVGLYAVEPFVADAVSSRPRGTPPPIVGPAWVTVVPASAGERTLGAILVRTLEPPSPDPVRDATAVLMGEIGAGMAGPARPRPRGVDARSGGLGRGEDGLDRKATPVWGVMALDHMRARRVVVVEDDVDIAEGVRDALAADGYEVELANRGDDGLAAARRSTPDLIILDVRLPDMDGFKMARELWRDRRTSAVPILFLSGASDLASRVRTLQSEEADFLPKPFAFKDLLARVEQAILRAETRNRLLFSARQDELTGLGNLRLFEERLVTEAARIDRYGTPLSIVVMDVDKLKTINDRHGHAAGSAVLRSVGEALAHAIRETDLAVRYGGDEFVVLLPHTELADGVAFADRILTRVRELRPCGLTVSVSLGVAAFDKLLDRTVDHLFERADQAAYRAKREGGNGRSVDTSSLSGQGETATGGNAPAAS
jgi:diguanylate cyclase (GGDEF)-like protein